MKIILLYFRLASVHIAALLYCIFAGVCTQIPLFNYLGYEFSALLTIPTAFISGVLTLYFLKFHLTQPFTYKNWLFVLRDYFIVNSILLLIPLTIISLNALIVKNCSFTQGITYYFLIPFCTMIFCVSLSLIVKIIFKKSIIVYCVIIIALLFHIIAITYTQPQLFAYNFILGYFPGITYDEVLRDISTLILYREFTLIASLLFITLFFLLLPLYTSHQSFFQTLKDFYLSKSFSFYREKLHFNVPKEQQMYVRKKFFRKLKILSFIAVFCFSSLMVGHFMRDELGMEFSEEYIQEQLGRRTESDHFILYYSPQKLSAGESKIVKSEMEFHYQHVKEHLQEKLSPHKKISVYMYPDNETKKKFIGTSTTNIAKPWRTEIHVTVTSFEETFRHELVHILAGNFGLPLINASPRMGLNEGLASAIAWDTEPFSAHEYCSALLREGALENIHSLFTYTGFSSRQSFFAYTVVGSFSKYLIEQFGIKHYKKIFSSGNFFVEYGTPLDSLISDWKLYLQNIDNSQLPTETIRTLFFQQSIFYKTCARVTAERNVSGITALREKKYHDAELYFSSSFDDAATEFSFRGMLHSLIAQEKYDEVINRYESLDENSQLRYNPAILLLVGDALWFQGSIEKAEKYYQKIKSLNINFSFNEVATVRSLLIKNDKFSFMKNFFYGGFPDSLRINFLLKNSKQDSSFIFYLLGKELFQQKKYFQSIIFLQKCKSLLRDTTLLYEATLMLANIFYKLEEYEKAKMMFWESKNYVRQKHHSFLEEKIELCEWMIISSQ